MVLDISVIFLQIFSSIAENLNWTKSICVYLSAEIWPNKPFGNAWECLHTFPFWFPLEKLNETLPVSMHLIISALHPWFKQWKGHKMYNLKLLTLNSARGAVCWMKCKQCKSKSFWKLTFVWNILSCNSGFYVNSLRAIFRTVQQTAK